MKKILMTLFLLLFITFVVSLILDFGNYEIKDIENDTAMDISTEHNEIDVDFVVNLSTKKYHLTTCIYADIKNESNRKVFHDEDFLIEHGYSACQKCILWRR